MLLTANHLVKDKKDIYVSFPAHQDNKTYHAIIVGSLEQPNGQKEYDGRSWNTARDIEILQLDKPHFHVDSIEICINKIDSDKKLSFFGFPQNRMTPLQAEATASIPTKADTGEGVSCTCDLRIMTLEGDSGSPVVDEKGLLFGVVIQKQNGVLSGRFVPVKCFAPFLLTILGSDVAESSAKLIIETEKSYLFNIFKPPKGSEWITNLRFASAIDWIITHKELIQKLKEKEKIECPVRDALIERELGYDFLSRFSLAYLKPNELQEEAKNSYNRGFLLVKGFRIIKL